MQATTLYISVSVEKLGVLGPVALSFFHDLGHCLTEATGGQRSFQLLLYCVSVVVRVQWRNAVAVRRFLRFSIDLRMEGFN